MARFWSTRNWANLADAGAIRTIVCEFGQFRASVANSGVIQAIFRRSLPNPEGIRPACACSNVQNVCSRARLRFGPRNLPPAPREFTPSCSSRVPERRRCRFVGRKPILPNSGQIWSKSPNFGRIQVCAKYSNKQIGMNSANIGESGPESAKLVPMSTHVGSSYFGRSRPILAISGRPLARIRQLSADIGQPRSKTPKFG